ncbi:kinase-like protein [Rhizoctonia solani]|uniref:Kinase-like protein n=1 Tax=Rhizoctonia solani TaxID=456999 RepID=A0A8H7M420_9AGAM|nr:kinase-like protein [Rhizoctonia solani]
MEAHFVWLVLLGSNSTITPGLGSTIASVAKEAVQSNTLYLSLTVNLPFMGYALNVTVKIDAGMIHKDDESTRNTISLLSYTEMPHLFGSGRSLTPARGDRPVRPASAPPQSPDVTMNDDTDHAADGSTHRETTPENEHRALASLGIQCALSLAEVTAELAPVPYIGPLVKCLTAVFQAVEKSRVTNNGHQYYPRINEGAHMLEETLNKIQKRAQHYNEMNDFSTFLKSKLISDEIEGLFSELDTCLQMFSYATDVAQAQWVSEFRSVQQQEARDIQKLKGELTKFNVNLEEMSHKEDQILENTGMIFGVLQQLLNDKTLVLEAQSKTTVDDYADAQQIVRTILSVTKLQLPPKLLLGRQCILDAKVPIKTGITCDIYTASFLGGERVAKKVFRLGMAERELVEHYSRRFMRIASLWYDFRSDYTLPFYGIGMEAFEGTEHFQLYMVSPLMKNFDAVYDISEEVQEECGGEEEHTAHSHRRSARTAVPAQQTSSGCSFWDEGRQYINHRQWRGHAWRLWVDQGKDLNRQFVGLWLTNDKQALENVENSGLPGTVMTGKTEAQRWMAPELFAEEPVLETPCDVWGWAMATLEIVSGSVPYYKHKQAITVMSKVMQGPPTRADHLEFNTYAYRPTEMWGLLEKCWKQNPEDRLSMDEVVIELKKIAKMPEIV